MAQPSVTRVEPYVPGLAREPSSNASKAPAATARSSRERRQQKRGHGLIVLIAALLAVLAAGFSARHLGLINPERGLGYAIGITAGVMLLTVLLYP